MKEGNEILFTTLTRKGFAKNYKKQDERKNESLISTISLQLDNYIG